MKAVDDALQVAVVGGGIAGLAAAFELGRAGHSVTLLESTDRIGGKLRAESVGPITVDVGAESILARRGEALALMDAVELSYTGVDVAAAYVWSRGALRPMPRTVMGIPADPALLVESGICDTLATSTPQPVPTDDVSVADFVRDRVGAEVLDRLVEPLLGGVYAGNCEELSLNAAAPNVRALGPDLFEGAKRQLSDLPAPTGSVFVAPDGGVASLPPAVAEAGTFSVRTNSVARELRRHLDRWQIAIGSTTSIETIEADAVIVATPAPAASRLLAQVAPTAAFALAGIEYASVAIVTLVVEKQQLPAGSGFLVPSIEDLTIKAATFSSQKWTWTRQAAGDAVVIRASVGRMREAMLLQHDDADLVQVVVNDLTAVLSQPMAVRHWHVQRWGGGLPQYAVGHLNAVTAIEADVASVPGLAVCGAAYRGVGIPAVIASARSAVAHLTLENAPI